MVFVGFVEGSKVIRYYDTKKRNIKVSRNIAFNKNQELKEVEIPGLGLEEGKVTMEQQILPNPPDNKSQTGKQPDMRPQTPPPRESNFDESLLPHGDAEPPQQPLRSLCERTRTIDYKKAGNPDACTSATTAIDRERTRQLHEARKEKEENRTLFSKVLMEDVKGDDVTLPRTIQEALEGPEKEHWLKAILEELGNLEKMGTWDLEDLPPGREAVGCKWVFTKKRDEKGNIIHYKARLVAQGFSQKPGMDFDLDGTYAPVMRLEMLRACLALSAIKKLITFQLDVVGAYLNGRLDEEIYMKQPPGFDDKSGQVCRLHRLLYGLKQAGNVWNKEFNATMKEIGFSQLKSDYCCYIRRDSSNSSPLGRRYPWFYDLE
ncbi:hypothetical protein EST38_g10156 [Candolleomyces aberdarensis]|uniref:Reverse transcriptase Ty1/copia-type domain-containing protein n=1 Tax=Candolleomyces aberdarensis TaxID=2316362 RepID=A0A4Q2D844_9AGAR|nr:hypothetical protein EST38_g10156 [Candolleomyces aberdarensis]